MYDVVHVGRWYRRLGYTCCLINFSVEEKQYISMKRFSICTQVHSITLQMTALLLVAT